MIENTLPYGETPDPEKRRCYDCGHLKAALSWWCGSEEAGKWRGTTIPGVHGCRFWKPCGVGPPPFRQRIGRVRRLLASLGLARP